MLVGLCHLLRLVFLRVLCVYDVLRRALLVFHIRPEFFKTRGILGMLRRVAFHYADQGRGTFVQFLVYGQV